MMGNKQTKKIAIIGAGPAGLATAVTLSRALGDFPSGEFQVDLFEKNSEAGKKILATGNGKCNISNSNAPNYKDTESFFKELGLLFSEEDEGRMYPHSKQAKSVRDILVASIDDSRVSILTDRNIKNVVNNNTGFTVYDEKNNTSNYHIVVATTGGKAGTQYGSEGDGLRFARESGIDMVSIMPALVPMNYGKNPGFDMPSLKGVRANVNLKLMISDKCMSTERGEIQFTDYGLSGICIFNLSRYLRNAPRKDKDIVHTQVIIDFAPDYSEEELENLFKQKNKVGLKGVVNEKVERLLLAGGYNPAKDPKGVSKLLKEFPVNIKGTKGWKEAQVTCGGIDLKAIDEETMECKDIKNLFFAGEILNYDGPCGGYNLDWAWSTGIKAAQGVLKSITAND